MPPATEKIVKMTTRNLFFALASMMRSIKEDDSATRRLGDSASDCSTVFIPFDHPFVESATSLADRSYERFVRRSFHKRRRSNESFPRKCNRADAPFRDALGFRQLRPLRR